MQRSSCWLFPCVCWLRSGQTPQLIDAYVRATTSNAEGECGGFFFLKSSSDLLGTAYLLLLLLSFPRSFAPSLSLAHSHRSLHRHHGFHGGTLYFR